MSDLPPEPGIDPAAARTVVDIAAHIARLRDAATALQGTFDTKQRGYFTPSEDEQVEHLWVSYHQSRAALLEMIHSIRREVGKASGEHAGDFAVAYAATLVLVNAARSLRNLFGENQLVRRKLNQSFDAYRIPKGSFDEIQISLTDPGNALRIREANDFYSEYESHLHDMSADDPSLAAVIAVIEGLRESTAVPTTRYVKARIVELGRETRDRILLGNVSRAVYAIQEWGSRLVSNISTIPDHVPALPTPIADQMLAVLKPGDVLVTRKDNAMTNYFLPGYWPHVAMYTGDGLVLESLKDGVQERSMQSPFGNDAVAVIRPQLHDTTIQKAITRGKSHVGKPYDFDFDFTRADRLVCTEVVYRSYEGLGGCHFELTRRAGRETLSAEDLLNLALRNHLFEPVTVYCARFGDKLLQGDPMREVLCSTMAEPAE
ncbi:MAG: YiiX/YebB-like N1pC/P60 family cysteine hydrolase [Rubripirellula sp.]